MYEGLKSNDQRFVDLPMGVTPADPIAPVVRPANIFFANPMSLLLEFPVKIVRIGVYKPYFYIILFCVSFLIKGALFRNV